MNAMKLTTLGAKATFATKTSLCRSGREVSSVQLRQRGARDMMINPIFRPATNLKLREAMRKFANGTANIRWWSWDIQYENCCCR